MEKNSSQAHSLEEISILSWVLKKGILNEKGDPLEYYDRPWLLDILTDWNKDIVVKKCAQIGGSVTFNLKVLFAIKNFGFNCIYTFPTDSDVNEFVTSKTNKIIQANHHEFKGMPVDNVERKELNNRFLFFKGTVSKTAAIMTSADLLVHDEADRSDQKTLETYKSRTKASWYKGRWIFSNPTTEKGVVDNAWQESDQKEWTINCPACKVDQILSFPASLNLVKKCFQCQFCKVEISNDVRRQGRWVAQKPESEKSGYHISLLMASWISADEVIKDSQGDQEYFFNFVLGEPYNPGDLRISKSTILDNWTPKDLNTGNYYLGVDVGNIKHYVLGSEKGVLKVGRFDKWAELDDMMVHYKPVLVIDAMPDNTMSRYFVNNYLNAQMSFFQENTANPQTIVWWGENDKQGIVYSNRNRVLDQLIDEILQAKILFGVESNQDFRDYIKHWETLRRIKETNNRGIESYKWESTTGQDHYCFATLYYYLATLTKGNGVLFAEKKEDFQLIGRDNTVGDLAEAIRINNKWE